MATDAELRRQLVAKEVTRVGKNYYTQDDRRYQVGDEPTGYSDCSSLQWWVHKQVLGIDIGDYTGAQIVSSRLTTVSMSISGGHPDASVMYPADLLFYDGGSGTVGHVEMYMGDSQLIGHGSGWGPVIKDMASYNASRYSSGRGIMCVRRALTGPEKEPIDPAVPPSISKAGSELSLTDGAGRLRLYCYDGVPGIGIIQNGESIYWDFETIRQLLER